MGESGCGKSTLIFAISNLLSPPAGITSGSVSFRGREMAQMSDKQLRHIRWRDFSVVMQSAMNALNPVLTVGQQLRDAIRAHALMSNEEIAERSAEVLRLVSIDPVHLRSYPHQLSGGMRQRAMIAMSLLFTPELVIMDEPTSALDVVGQRSLMRQVKELQDRLGFAVIFVTHDISLVRHFSDRLLVMYAGQVAELGATADGLRRAPPPLRPRPARGLPLDPRARRSHSPASRAPRRASARLRRAAASSPAAPTRCPSARSASHRSTTWAAPTSAACSTGTHAPGREASPAGRRPSAGGRAACRGTEPTVSPAAVAADRRCFAGRAYDDGDASAARGDGPHAALRAARLLVEEAAARGRRRQLHDRPA